MASISVFFKRLFVLAVAVCALSLAACGQKGPLVAPTANTNAQTQPVDPNRETGTQVEPVPTKAPDERFILDGLL